MWKYITKKVSELTKEKKKIDKTTDITKILMAVVSLRWENLGWNLLSSF